MKTTTKEKMRACVFVKGTHIQMSDPCITEMVASMGFDFIWIDMEHSPTDHQVLVNHLIAAKAGGTDTIVRIPWNDPIMVKRVLDMGPTGILFPTINTVEELDKAMASTLYPPDGNRGFGPIRAVNYALMDQEYYIDHVVKEQMIRCVQIESKTAVDNLPQMVKNPWVDCFIIGPCDMSGSIGQLFKIYEKPTGDLIRKAARICNDAGKSIGISLITEDKKLIEYWHDMGINVISCGSETCFITNGCKHVLEIMDGLENEDDCHAR